MKMHLLVSLLASSVLVAACASKPIVSGESTTQQKSLLFPKVGQQSSVAIGNLMLMHTDYRSRFTYRLKRPFHMSVMLLNKVQVSTEEPLTESTIDGVTAYCSHSKVFHDAIAGPWSIACFHSSEKGKFDSVNIAPGDVMAPGILANKEIAPPIEYEMREEGFTQASRPMKRELVFDGRENNVLMFTEKIFDVSLNTPSRVKPLIAKVDSWPAKITLDGAEVNVIEYSNSSLTYVVTAHWN